MLKQALCFTSLMCCTHAALAWGVEGHQVVALIAYDHLTPAAKSQVDRLLAADNDTLTAPDIASRSVWADAWRNSDQHGPRYKQTFQWHFVDIELDQPDIKAACFGQNPLATNTMASDGAADDCVVDKIDQFNAELANAATPTAEKILALKYLLHFVGDMHQPLHVADNHDRGGNCEDVIDAVTNHATKLHSWWDEDVVKGIGTDAIVVAKQLDSTISKQKIRRWQRGSTTDWAWEGYKIATTAVYTDAVKAACNAGTAVGTVTLNSSYRTQATAVAKTQLQKAGIRLAYLLNQDLK